MDAPTPPSDPAAALRQDLEQLQKLQYSDPRRGLRFGLRLRREATAASQQGTAAWAVHHASICALRLFRHTTARVLNTDATRRFEELGNLYGLTSAENVRGVMAQQRGRHGEAYTHFHAVLLAAGEHDFPKLYAHALSNLALSSRRMGDNEAALNWTVQSLDFARERGEQENLASTMTNAVPLTLQLGHLEQAERYAQEAYTIATALHHPVLRAVTLSNLSLVRTEQGDHAAALRAAEQSLRIDEELGHTTSVIYARAQMGRVLIDLGEFTRAEQELTGAYHAAQDLDEAVDLQVELLHLLGRLKFRLGAYPEARGWLQAAEDGAREHGRQENLSQTLLERSVLEEAAGDPWEALRAFRAHHHVDRQLRDEQHNQRTHALMLAHELREHRRLNAELTAAIDHLQHTANHDSLTDTLNRRAFNAGAEGRIAATEVHSLVVIDLDHFKRVNDTFGHNTGDEVLRQAVGVIRRCVREQDLLCRWGGEEFTLLLPGATPEQAMATCQRLRREFHGHAWPMGLAVTASFGISRSTGSLETMITEADTALYAAKEAGRDQALVYRDGMKVKT